MTPLDIAIVATVLGLGAVLQSAVGFGMALIAIPLLVWAGHPLPVAVAMVLGAAAVQTGHGTYVVREYVVWRRALRFATLQWVGISVGITCMSLLVRSDPALIKRTIGAALVVIVTTQLLFRPTPREHLGRRWAVVAAGSAGFISGLVGMGGPPLVLFALAHTWGRDMFRAFLWSQILLALPMLSIALSVRFGPQLLVWVAVGTAMAPVVWLGSRLGLVVSERWGRKRLQLAAVLVLYAIGFSSLLGAGLGGRSPE